MHSVVKVTVVVPAKSLGVVSGGKRTEGGKLLLTSRPIKLGTLEHVSTSQISFQAHLNLNTSI